MLLLVAEGVRLVLRDLLSLAPELLLLQECRSLVDVTVIVRSDLGESKVEISLVRRDQVLAFQ